MHSNRQFSVSIQGKSTVKSQGDGGRSSVDFFVEGTQMTVNRTKPTKAELHKMLAEAVSIAQGAIKLQPVLDPPSTPKPNKRLG
jgi:hypothetical protein